MSTIRVEAFANAPFSIALDQPDLVVRTLGDALTGGIRLPYRALRIPRSGSLVRRVVVRSRMQIDVTERGRSHDEIVFDYDTRSRWLPNFAGSLRFRVDALRTLVILEGRYVPPAGAFGELFDRFVGHRLAVAMSRDILDRSIRSLEACWAENCERHRTRYALVLRSPVTALETAVAHGVA